MPLTHLDQPVTEPVSLADIKEHLRVTHDEEDTYLIGLVKAARGWCEMYVRISLARRHYRFALHAWPTGIAIALPRPPLVSVTEIRYRDPTETVQTLDAAEYLVSPSGYPGQVVLATADRWPAVSDNHRQAPIEIDYIAGDGPAAPAEAQHAIKLLVAGWYEQREYVTDRSLPTLPMGVRTLLDSIYNGAYP